jgi:hypothetical protein
MHTYELVDSGNFRTVSIKETNSFRGIPYADYFTVNTEWVVVSGSAGEGGCSVKILLDFVFLKSTWLQGTIESNTRAELLTVYELWLSSAEDHLQSVIFDRQIRGTEHLSQPVDFKDVNQVSIDIEKGFTVITTEAVSMGGMRVTRSISRNSLSNLSRQEASLRTRSKDEDNRSLNSGFGSEDELQFFDCEEDSIQQERGEYGDRRERDRLLPNLPLVQSSRITTPEKLRILYSQPSIQTGEAQEVLPSSLKELAVTVVETLFVLAEFSFWKVIISVIHMIPERSWRR